MRQPKRQHGSSQPEESEAATVCYRDVDYVCEEFQESAAYEYKDVVIRGTPECVESSCLGSLCLPKERKSESGIYLPIQ